MVRGPRTAMKSGPHSPQLEKALAQKRRPNTAINQKKKKKFKKRNTGKGRTFPFTSKGEGMRNRTGCFLFLIRHFLF